MIHLARSLPATLGVLVCCTGLVAQAPLVYTVDGSLTNPGTNEFTDIQSAINAIPVQSGTTNPNIASQSVTIQIKDTVTYTPPQSILIRTRGAPGIILRLESAPTNVGRVTILGSNANYNSAINVLGACYWHIRGLEVDGTVAANPSADKGGIRVGPQRVDAAGQYNTAAPLVDLLVSHHIVIEDCEAHHCSYTGIGIDSSHDCSIVNCDAHHNTDEQGAAVGDNADGIQIFYSTFWNTFGGDPRQSHGNSIIGCRSWRNSDDGFDCWRSFPVEIRSSWAWSNGTPVLSDGVPGFRGNGVGFKLGREGDGNTVVNCVAFDNDEYGFSSNGSDGVCRFYNCTAFRNRLYNFLSRYADSDQPHILVNNLSWQGGNGDHSVNGAVVEINNSWNIGYTFSAGDFEAIPAATGFTIPARLKGGFLPPDALVRPVPGTMLKGLWSHIPPTLSIDTQVAPPRAHLGAIDIPFGGPVSTAVIEGRTQVGALVDEATLDVELALYATTNSASVGKHNLYLGYSGITDPAFPTGLQIDDVAVYFEHTQAFPSGTASFFAIPLSSLNRYSLFQVVGGSPLEFSPIVQLRSDT
ncbi:MAG: right-handed parallel beta-helix repeat-containing protein [Planctomycetes bacterium]|nr:right-handed parallel beta-helix repeat-containing protein [Planctomycetota bacterium]